ncbi:MAG: methionyl-tRNA formyltransferase [Bacillaceae bacterium]|nr:methionyl-tRNA formyltransferase [Bacillaceae bacterium]
MEGKRVVFVGTVISSYNALEELLRNNVNVVGVFTLDEAYSKNVSDFISLKPLCKEFNVPMYTFQNVNEEHIINKIKELNPYYIFVIGLSQLVSKQILSIPHCGSIGAHPSLLPQGRGRASIPWSIINNQKETGLSIFFLEDGVDSGDVISQEVISIEKRETANSLYQKIVHSLRNQIKKIVPLIKKGELTGTPQNNHLATYSAKRTPEDGLINWDRPAEEIDRFIRALTYPYPGAYSYYKNKKIIIRSAEPIVTDKYVGLPGQIVKIEQNKVYVKVKDGVLRLKNINYLDKDMEAHELFKREGVKLEYNLNQIISSLEERIENLERRLEEKNGSKE